MFSFFGRHSKRTYRELILSVNLSVNKGSRKKGLLLVVLCQAVSAGANTVVPQITALSASSSPDHASSEALIDNFPDTIPVQSAPSTPSATPFRRDIVTLSNADQFDYKLDYIEARILAETPLNHLGMRVSHLDWSAEQMTDSYEQLYGKIGLKPVQIAVQPAAHADQNSTSYSMRRIRQGAFDDSVRGALIWLHGETLAEPNVFLAWAISFMEQGRWLVLMGDPAFETDLDGNPADPKLLDAFYKTLGLATRFLYLDGYEPLKVDHLDPAVVGFEFDISKALTTARIVHQTIPRAARPFLSISDHKGNRSDVITLTSSGGYIAPEYSYRYFEPANLGYWVIDPIAFFRNAFRLHDSPVPDVTTLTGNRIYYSHVDGDGWNSISEIKQANGTLDISARLMLDQLVRPFPDLPVTIAPVTGDLDLSLVGNQYARDIASQLFKLPQVEIGSHTHTHPFDWHFYEPDNYDAGVEARLFDRPRPNASMFEKLVHRTGRVLQRKSRTREYRNKRYKFPRAYYNGQFRFYSELRQSVQLLNELAPPGKPVTMIQWSGNTLPGESVLRTTRLAGLGNMNGGGTRYDATFPSLSFVSPLTRTVGKELQIFTSMASEAFFTDNWTRRFYGFRSLAETIDRTESPYRIRPVNIYYHVYSAEKDAALQAVISNLNYARTLELTPIEASQYIRIIEGWHAAQLQRLGDQGWIISNRSALNTLRMDQTDRQIDYASSQGVIGHRYHQGALYIALDPSVEIVRLQWLQTSEADTTTPYLISSRWQVSDVEANEKGVSLQAVGFGDGDMRWYFPQDCAAAYQVTLVERGQEENSLNENTQVHMSTVVAAGPLMSDEQGVVSLPLTTGEENSSVNRTNRVHGITFGCVDQFDQPMSMQSAEADPPEQFEPDKGVTDL